MAHLGTIDRTSQDARELRRHRFRASRRPDLFGLPNQFLMGASYDHGSVDYGANSELGYFGPALRGQQFPNPSSFRPAGRSAAAQACRRHNDYVGVFFANTTDLTQDFVAHPRRLVGTMRASNWRTRTSIRRRGRQADRHARVLPLQSHGRRHVQAAAGPDTVRRLLGSQPRADGGRACLRRSRRHRA